MTTASYGTFTCLVCRRERKISNPRVAPNPTICASCAAVYATPPVPAEVAHSERDQIIQNAASALASGDTYLANGCLALVFPYGPVLAMVAQYGVAILAAERERVSRTE